MLALADPMHLALKAGVASALAVVTCRLLGLEDPLSAGFVALACVSPSAYAGLRNGLAQIAGSLLGSIVAGLPLLLWPSLHGSPAALTVSMAAAVLLCLTLRLSSAYFVSGFTVLYLHLLPYPSAIVSASERLGAVLLGVALATLVNTVISALDGERIAARRVARVRHEVGRALVASAEAIRARADLSADPFEQAFGAVAALRADLADAARERLFPGASRARASAEAGLRAARALEDSAHLGKEVAVLARSAALTESARGLLADAVAAWGDALAAGHSELARASDLEAALEGAPVLASAADRMRRACEASAGNA